MDQQALDAMQQEGMVRATAVFDTLEKVTPPFNPVDAFKCVCSMKIAEILARTQRAFPDDLIEMVDICGEFIEGVLSSANTTGENGDMAEGRRCQSEIEKLYPYEASLTATPVEATIRMHMHDGLLVLIASKFNRQQETKDSIDLLQRRVEQLLVMRMILEAAKEMDIDGTPVDGEINPNDVN